MAFDFRSSEHSGELTDSSRLGQARLPEAEALRQGREATPELVLNHQYTMKRLTFHVTQHYCCVVIPNLYSDGNLPEGIHPATWAELVTAFGTNPHRQRLLLGLRSVLLRLYSAGCGTVYLDGSFVTAKDVPNDFDGAWDMHNVDLIRLRRLEPTLFDFSAGRAAQKRRFMGELFPANSQEESTGRTFLDFFQVDRETGASKGIIAIDLRSLS